MTRAAGDGAYTVHAHPAGASSNVAAGYDFVVLAAPCPQDHATAAMAGNLLRRCRPLEYTHVHTTLVWGVINASFLGGSSRSDPDTAGLNAEFADILVADGAPVPFNSIGKVGAAPPAADGACARTMASALPPGARLPRWKLFSPARLGDAALSDVFLCREGTPVRHAWDAPGAYPTSRPLGGGEGGYDGEEGFILDGGGESAGGGRRGMLLHPSAIEAATSAMEVMAVAATNAALLVRERL